LLLGNQWRPPIGRHLALRDALDQQAAVGVAGIECGAGLAPFQRGLAAREVESPLVIGAVVALQAVARNEHAHACVHAVVCRGAAWECKGAQDDRAKWSRA